MSMIERVARALVDAMCEFGGEVVPTDTEWANRDEDAYEMFSGMAIAAIAAMRDPTKEMIDAVRMMHGDQYVGIGMGVEAWTTMIDAALRECGQ